MTYRGLTWDHPRGRTALRRAVEKMAPGLIAWDVQPLEGFESAPIADLCARYDLVVMDHPHLGEALAAGCIQPLNDVFSNDVLAGMTSEAIGHSTRSYLMNGRSWALPLDAATQVMAFRADHVEHAPGQMEDVIALAAETGKVAICIAGPHAILSFLSLCSALDDTLDLADSDRWPSDDVGRAAYDLMARLYPHTPAELHGLNPIAILERMSGSDDVILCPHIYGYVTYSAPDLTRRVTFANAPCVAEGRPGSIIGGTGIAISTRCEVTDALRDHLAWLMSTEAQVHHIPQNDGQPSSRLAWADDGVNALWGDFYRNTRATIDSSTVRPRHDGYVAFQTSASVFLRGALAAGSDHAAVIDHLKSAFFASCSPPRETQ